MSDEIPKVGIRGNARRFCSSCKKVVAGLTNQWNHQRLYHPNVQVTWSMKKPS